MWVCGLEIEGSIWLLFAIAICDALLGTALGLLASAFARTEFQVVQFLPVFVFPQVLLGGIFLPTDQLPTVLEAISQWLPLTFAIDALNAVATGDEDAEWIAMKLLAVVAWIVGSIVRRLDHAPASHAVGVRLPPRRGPRRAASAPPRRRRGRGRGRGWRTGARGRARRARARSRRTAGYTSRSVSAVRVCILPQCGRPP